MTQRHEESDDDTYVTLGSAFQKLETVEDVEKAKRKKDKEHYVTDEQGRRRFHGAFTGGFSAGYYNTVGSKEGWTPSTFVSSKVKKAAFSSQRPEDFMDDEDLGEFGIAPRAVTARETFNVQKEEQTFSAGQKRQAELRSVIPGDPVLHSVIVPAQSTIGATLLKSMGWKDGQGVGPKTVKYSSKQESKNIYGCSVPRTLKEGMDMGAEEDSFPKEAEGFLFAPSDVTSWEVEGKDDMHGIGYRGMANQHVLGSRKATSALYGMSGKAFGTGALDEEDEEEEDDIYGVETFTSYDSTLAPEGDISMERKFGWTGGLHTDWSISSFKKASKHITNTKKYPPPDIPRDFECRHMFGSSGILESPSEEVSKKPYTSKERLQILSDKPDSVFNLLSHSDRERLKSATETAKRGSSQMPDVRRNSAQPSPLSQQAPPSHLALLPLPAHLLPKSRPSIQSFQSSGIKPFTRDPAKQVRYDAYLEGKASPAVEGMTEWERQREKDKFLQVAKVFQPLSSSMSSRFTRGEGEEDKCGSGFVDVKEAKQPERPLTPESDAVQAAKAGMFGLLTREVHDWHPHRVICKRFNIPDPYPNSSALGVTTERERKKLFGDTRNINFLHTDRILASESQPGEGGASVDPQRPAEVTGRSEEEKGSSHVPEKRDVAVLPSDEPETVEEVAEERPSIDLFKAIFADSSSESSDDERENINTHANQSHGAAKNVTEIQQPSQRRWQDLSVITSTVLPPVKLPQSDTESWSKDLSHSREIIHQRHHKTDNRYDRGHCRDGDAPGSHYRREQSNEVSGGGMAYNLGQAIPSSEKDNDAKLQGRDKARDDDKRRRLWQIEEEELAREKKHYHGGVSNQSDLQREVEREASHGEEGDRKIFPQRCVEERLAKETEKCETFGPLLPPGDSIPALPQESRRKEDLARKNRRRKHKDHRHHHHHHKKKDASV